MEGAMAEKAEHERRGAWARMREWRRYRRGRRAWRRDRRKGTIDLGAQGMHAGGPAHAHKGDGPQGGFSGGGAGF
jgi:hypothetical protein